MNLWEKYENFEVSGFLDVGDQSTLRKRSADNSYQEVSGLALVQGGVAASAADALAMPLTNRYVAKTTGADAEALTIADGFVGQKITIALVVDGGGTGTLTPGTGNFATIIFADAGDTASLEFIDSVTGWIITGLSGLIANPVVTY